MLDNLYIQKEIDFILNENSITECYNLYLIGSRTNKKYSLESDYDFLIYFKNVTSVKKLTLISNLLNSSLKKVNNISIKVFNKHSFDNLYNQDYFRYIEYKTSYKIITETHSVFTAQFDKLSNEVILKQLLNSIIIQYWWSIITISISQELENKIKTKLLTRINRNIELYNNEVKGNITLSKTLKLLTQELLFKRINSLEFDNYTIFVKDYFNSFEHEKINKSKYYQNALKSNFNTIKFYIDKITINLKSKI